MKIAYNWLKDYLVHLSINPHHLAQQLSLQGLEVEEVIEKGLDIPHVVVGKVVKCLLHPNADKLKICEVDTGRSHLSIVCGAPNIAEGQKVPVAVVGASLPSGLKIKKTKIRGVVSEGMICSQQELALEEKSDGIWVLPVDSSPGTALDKALDSDTDYIFDIAVTANRPDCLSHIGVAREIGAIIDQHIMMPKVEIKESGIATSSKIKIEIENPQSCPRYSARIIKGVLIGESPTWLVNRLEAVGLRPINNVVDVTNYVLMETGHPLHAFDHDMLKGQKIVVRDSYENEKFVTLDDKERILKKGTVMICDAEEPVAIGGIMGGLNTEVSSNTVDVLLESAYFQPESIQRSSHYLGLSTEASQRFERGADPNGTQYALDRAAQLIAEICNGEVCKGVVDVYPNPISEWEIPLEGQKINKLLGTQISDVEMTQILKKIDLHVQEGNVVIPTHRPDLQRSADIAEEIARLYGLEGIPAKKHFTINYNFSINEFDLFVDDFKNILTGLGLQEVVTGSMINRDVWEDLTGNKIYPIMNPISRDLNGMRNTLLLSLLQVIRHNRNRQISNIPIFEINRVFYPPKSENEQPQEHYVLALAITGKRDGDLWYSSHQSYDFYDIKGIIETLFHKISLDNWDFIYYSNFATEDDSLGIQVDGNTIGFLGKLNKKVAGSYEFEDSVHIAELKLKPLFNKHRREKTFKRLPKFPWIERDVALIVDDQLDSEKIVEVIQEKGGNLLIKNEIFDVYRGKQIPAGKKSLAFRLTFQSSDKTLTEDEINSLMDKIIKGVCSLFNAKLRE